MLTQRSVNATGTHNRKIVTFALMMALGMAALEQTVVSTAMPTIIKEMGGFSIYSWVFSIYLFTSTITMPYYGQIADSWGRKPALLLAMVLFMVGSILSGSAHNMSQLVLFRALQGLGAGGILPSIFTFISDLYTLQERAKMQGVFTSVWGTAGLCGPTLGAFLTTKLSWRWVFYVNIPFGILSMLALIFFYREQFVPHRLKLSWNLFRLIPFDIIFRNSRVRSCIWSSIVFGILMFSVTTYIPLYVQEATGGSAAEAGAILTPMILLWALSSAVSGALILKLGFKGAGLAGGICAILGTFLLSLTPLFSDHKRVLLASMVFLGSGFGPLVHATMLGAQDAVPAQRRGATTSAVLFFRYTGGAAGLALLGTLLNGKLARLGSHSPAALQQGLHLVFIWIATISIFLIPPSLRLSDPGFQQPKHDTTT